MDQLIALEAKHRQRVIRYAEKNGVTRAADRFHCCRQAIYNWMNRYDGKL